MSNCRICFNYSIFFSWSFWFL